MKKKVIETLSWNDMVSRNKEYSLKEDYSINIGVVYNDSHTNSVCKFISLLIAELMDKETRTELKLRNSVSGFYEEIYEKVLAYSLELLHENENTLMHNIKKAIEKAFNIYHIAHKKYKIHRLKYIGVNYRNITDKLISGYPILIKYNGVVNLVKGYKVFGNNNMYLEVIGNYDTRFKSSYINFKDINFFSYMVG